MKKDAPTWQIFETHCQRKHGENETRVAQLRNILENKYEDEENIGLIKSTKAIDVIRESITAKRPRRIFGKKLKSIDGFEFNKTVTSVPDTIKRVAYQKVSEMEVKSFHI